jgi:dienelactone hydrolase
MLLAGDDEVAASHPCRAMVEKGATPDVLRTVTCQGALQAFDVSEIPAETRGPAGMMGYNAEAAAAAWGEVQRFLNFAR